MNNQNINTLIKWLASQFNIMPVPEQIGQIFSFFVISIWLVMLILYKDKSRDIPMISFGVVGMVVSSSLIWYHHYVLLLAPIAFLLLSTDVWSRTGKLILVLSVVGVLLINTARFFEFLFMLPPLFTIIGYLTIYLASWLVLTLSKSS